MARILPAGGAVGGKTSNIPVQKGSSDEGVGDAAATGSGGGKANFEIVPCIRDAQFVERSVGWTEKEKIWFPHVKDMSDITSNPFRPFHSDRHEEQLRRHFGERVRHMARFAREKLQFCAETIVVKIVLEDFSRLGEKFCDFSMKREGCDFSMKREEVIG